MVLINGSQILLPNDYQKYRLYSVERGFCWGGRVVHSLAKYFKKGNIVALQEKATLKRQPRFCYNTETHRHGIFIFKIKQKENIF